MKNMTYMKKGFGEKKFFGSVLVGCRGQVVIPEKARELYNIKAGDRLLVFKGPGEAMVFIKIDSIKNFYENLMKRISEISES